MAKLAHMLGIEPEPIGVAPEAVERGSDEEAVIEALRQVIDPELGINIVDLGLVYGIRFHDGQLAVTLTMTTPACPLGSMIRSQVRDALEPIFPERRIDTRLVWDPPWTSERMSRAAKEALGVG